MYLLLAFMFGAVGLSAWEVRGGPRWRTPIVALTCVVVGIGYLSLRIL